MLATSEVRGSQAALTLEMFQQAIATLERVRPQPKFLPVPPDLAIAFQPHRAYCRALRRYARIHASRPGRRVAWRKLTRAQWQHASRLWVDGLLVSHAAR